MRMRNFLVGGSLLAMLVGCPGRLDSPLSPGRAAPVAGEPTAEPSFFPVPEPGASAPWLPWASLLSDSGLKFLGGSLEVTLSQEGQPLPRAHLRLYGPTLAMGSAQAGRGLLEGLEEGRDYRLVIEAPDRETCQVEGLSILPDSLTKVAVALPPGATIAGKVLSQGAPIAGALVSDGLNTAMTNEQGEYRLSGLPRRPLSLFAAKGHYKTAVSSHDGGGGRVDFDLEPRPWVFSLDSGGLASGKFQGLRQALKGTAPWRFSLSAPGRDGVRILACPDEAPEAIDEMVNFVKEGGKLLMMGEWGGFSGFSTPGANRLAHRLGFHFNPDLVRVPGESKWPEWLHIPSGSSPTRRLALYNACSLFGLPPMAPRAQAGGYRVQSSRPSPMVLAGTFGAGKVVVLSDASAWTDEDTDADGVPNYREDDNMAFFQEMLAW